MTAGLALCVAVLLPATAWAGDDTYGPTTTEGGGNQGEVTCSLDITGGAPGQTGTATVTGVGAGQTVRITIGGLEAGEGTATGSAAMQITFTVPDIEAGQYTVAAVTPSATAECDGQFEVSDVGGISVPNAGGGEGNVGPLPKTGVYAGLLVAIAIALVVFGRTLLAESRRRKRRAWREQNRVQVLTRPHPDRRP